MHARLPSGADRRGDVGVRGGRLVLDSEDGHALLGRRPEQRLQRGAQPQVDEGHVAPPVRLGLVDRRVQLAAALAAGLRREREPVRAGNCARETEPVDEREGTAGSLLETVDAGLARPVAGAGRAEADEDRLRPSPIPVGSSSWARSEPAFPTSSATVSAPPSSRPSATRNTSSTAPGSALAAANAIPRRSPASTSYSEYVNAARSTPRSRVRSSSTVRSTTVWGTWTRLPRGSAISPRRKNITPRRSSSTASSVSTTISRGTNRSSGRSGSSTEVPSGTVHAKPRTAAGSAACPAARYTSSLVRFASASPAVPFPASAAPSPRRSSASAEPALSAVRGSGLMRVGERWFERTWPTARPARRRAGGREARPPAPRTSPRARRRRRAGRPRWPRSWPRSCPCRHPA